MARCLAANVLLLPVCASVLHLFVSPDGAYTLDTPAWSLVGAPIRLLFNGTWLSSSNGTLHPGQPVVATGSDAWGDFNSTELSWTGPGATVLVVTTWLQYEDAPACGFEASFPSAITTATSSADPPGVLLEFPSWNIGAPSSLGYLQWSGTMLNQKNDLGPFIGTWTLGANFSDALSSGPTVLFDEAGNESLVLSPSSQFMAISSAPSSEGDSLAWGPMGTAESLPVGFSYSCVAWFGATINGNVMAWGQALLSKHGKTHGLSFTDFTNTHLGYNTDNGAYYYYNTANYSNYSVALAVVNDYAVASHIPYRHILLDSWWYYKEEPKKGVLNWTAQDTPGYFTDGNAGLRALASSTNWKIIAHNRYWSPFTNYAKANGGTWDFFIDAPGTGAGMAVPLDQAFWVWLLQDSVSEWGLSTYEQDWLHNELEGVTALLTNVTLGRTWMLQMGFGAEAAGVSFQLCMAYPRHAMQSVEMPTATQIRVSDDHMPGVNDKHQWSLGYSCLLAWALGLGCFKDNFWSTSIQPGSSRPQGTEFAPALHCAVSTLSGGPVTPSDGIGFSDAALILRSCTSSGRLLQPSRGLTVVDAAAVGRAFPSFSDAPQGELYATYTFLAGNFMWDHVFAANLTSDYLLRPGILEPTRADASMRARWQSEKPRGIVSPGAASVAFSLNTTTLAFDSLSVTFPFDNSHPVSLPACGLLDFVLLHTAPVFSNGWALLGELNKWVPVSDARFNDVNVDGVSMSATVTGAVNEVVPVTFYDTSAGKVSTINCTIPESGRATVSVPQLSCA